MENMNHIHLATGNGEPPASRILPSFNSSAPVNNNSGGGGGTEAMNVDIARVKNELYDAETAFPVKVEQSPEALAEPPSATSLEQLFDQTINLSSDEEDIDDVVPAGQGDEGIEIDISERMQRIKRSPMAHRISMTEAIPDSGNINMSRPKLNTVKSEPSTFTTASTNENRQLPPAANETVNVSDDFEEHVSNPAPAADSNGIQQLAFTPQRRKVQPQDFHCNLTEDDQELIIVLEENNRNLVRVYAKTDDDVWYCHLCRQKSKKNRGFLGYMNADNTFDALINHECEPITYEESNRVQIYAETSSCANERNDGNRKRKIRIPSVSNDFYRADDYKFKKESVRTREQPRKSRRNRRSRTFDYPNFLDDDYLNCDSAGSGSPFNLETNHQSEHSPPTGDRNRDLSSSSSSSSSQSFYRVPSENWKYGYNAKGDLNKRIIVFENDKRFVREYSVYNNSIKCLECKGEAKKAKLDEHGKLHVPTDHVCNPRLYNSVQYYQQLYKKKSKKQPENYGTRSKKPRNDVELSRHEPSLNRNQQPDANNTVDVNQLFVPPVRANLVNFTPAYPSSQIATPPFVVQSNYSTLSRIFTSPVRFRQPSAYFLEACCVKLGLKYSVNAYTFWGRINVDVFNFNSIPKNTFLVTNPLTGFASLSLLFTVSEEFALQIKDCFNKYFLENLMVIGDLIADDLSQSSHPLIRETSCSNDLTEIHFVVLAHWFKCRFAVFMSDAWKNYGDWDDPNSEIPIVLMECNNGKYAPIISI